MPGFSAHQPYLNIAITLLLLGFIIGFSQGGLTTGIVYALLALFLIPLCFLTIIALISWLLKRIKHQS